MMVEQKILLHGVINMDCNNTYYTNYPTKDVVNNSNHEQICRWYRFLPSPMNADETEIINIIVKKFKVMGGFTPELSKKIGW